MTITIYTKTPCPQCDATKRAFKRAGVTWNEVDLMENAEALAKFKEQGFAQAPIVVAGDEVWSGFRFEKVREAIAAVKSAAPANA